MTEIESRTGIHLEDTEVTRIYTLGELLDAIEQRTQVVRSPDRAGKKYCRYRLPTI